MNKRVITECKNHIIGCNKLHNGKCYFIEKNSPMLYEELMHHILNMKKLDREMVVIISNMNKEYILEIITAYSDIVDVLIDLIQ